ncbi:peroxide stress protein YaaA [Arthrobacter sp. BL-252-APC-1A]|uniref:YaaA family protein n=1 Tax=Arthrobacter sp. BL-252-APC-1A TaxID=2606622 RepID=UPI0013126EF0|nr:peroxide stress protein YaaA [Arthrobacter sp. BL-252-APC-1A]MSR99761.1 peroxide stress protein YaaA [Arthrobacter sp. BL-252-APC-1A]
MLILLPPSEGKTRPQSGPALNPDLLRFPELAAARKEVLSALMDASAAQDAHTVLGVGASLASEVQRNTVLESEPCAPAHQVYSGVLYDALGYDSLTPGQQAAADEAVVVISALWGAIGFGDAIPAYRLSMGTKLPGIGRLAAFWKAALTEPLNRHAEEQLVVDCRSSTYAAAWQPAPERTAAVNVFQVRNGQRKVVSHFAKRTRGELARHLLARDSKAPATAEELLAAAAEKWEAELLAPAGRKPYQLNLILPGEH